MLLEDAVDLLVGVKALPNKLDVYQVTSTCSSSQDCTNPFVINKEVLVSPMLDNSTVLLETTFFKVMVDATVLSPRRSKMEHLDPLVVET